MKMFRFLFLALFLVGAPFARKLQKNSVQSGREAVTKNRESPKEMMTKNAEMPKEGSARNSEVPPKGAAPQSGVSKPEAPHKNVQQPIQKSVQGSIRIDKIIVRKSNRLVETYQNGELLKQYRCALGFTPTGPKEEEGDGKTPEGTYTIDYKEPAAKNGYKAVRLSYPNKDQRLKAEKRGKNPGGNICIHGLRYSVKPLGKDHIKSDWTKGCVGVTDEEMDEIFKGSLIGTVVEILP
ncbi:hypothetical protein AGMMS49949_06560 [Alphaproteobacteria bacterium]|nr:hypothetical protein AGMMS49949_06560 [Alphaproteobacteria bacterium]GHS96928.1 hypothetical protein AGMMS50296_3450 [Alphaproteobacteria bacterium]